MGEGGQCNLKCLAGKLKRISDETYEECEEVHFMPSSG
jgi:hypothetical protein